MSPLTPLDNHLLNAALGWIGLGNTAEAQRELAQISAPGQSHPDVLEARWSLCAHDKDWQGALALADSLVRQVPGRCSGWIHRSYSLHELKRTADALEQLLPAAQRFPQVSTIPYNLACYECQLGHLEGARRWLALAMSMGEQDRILEVARQDPDLQPLWPELEGSLGQ